MERCSMALKSGAMFGGAPAGPPWGWLGKDMSWWCMSRCLRRVWGFFSGFGRCVEVLPAWRGLRTLLFAFTSVAICVVDATRIRRSR
jgi:hypothetical protein